MANLLAIDQGTTSSRAIIFDDAANVLAVAQQEFRQYFPKSGWVEHDPEEIWSTTLAVIRESLSKAGISSTDLAGIGITNQRETTLIWDRKTGEVIHPAIVWQDRRTAEDCEKLKAAGLEAALRRKTGLLLDPYFSATKVKWLLDNVDGARQRAEAGDLAFGTVDTFLLWRLTGGKSHKTDVTNASRTALFNIHDQQWDEELLRQLDIPSSLLPEVHDCAADFGATAADVLGAEVLVAGIAGDQQAALFGQCCFESGMAKSTYGTGCFVIMNTGSEAVTSNNKLLTTVAYRLGGEVTYGLEGSIFVAGAAVQWVRDRLKFVANAAETEAIAERCGDTNGVYLVPSFTGLGAPYWDSGARGAIVGLNLDSGIDEIVTATLQSVCYQTRDLMRAMSEDGADPSVLRVDGGMVVNNWVCQNLADILRLSVDRPRITETTALGAAYLAGLQTGVFDSMAQLSSQWHLERQFEPRLEASESERLYQGWLAAVDRVKSAGP